MERDGWVSLWLGVATSEESLNRFVTPSYADDGDFVGPELSTMFGFDCFDEDFIESCYYDETLTDLSFLLHGSSYSDTTIQRFKAITSGLEPCNAVVLIYNFDLGGPTRSVSTPDVALRYVGSIEYR